jgi:hypothetical protein
MACAEMAFDMMIDSLHEMGIDALRCNIVEQCDISRVCRRVLLSGKPGLHLFGDLMQRVPDYVSAELRDVTWPSMPEKALKKSDPKAFKVATATFTQLLVEAVTACRDIFKHYSHNLFLPGYKAYCFKHRGLCSVWDPYDGPSLELCCAGSTCKDWSVQGLQLGLSGPSSLPFFVWLQEQVARKPAVLIHECTPRFPPELLAAAFGDEYRIESIIFSPEHLGVPNERLRIWSVCINKSAAVLTKGLDQFLVDLGCKRVLDFNVYFCASDEDIQEEIRARAIKEAVEPQDDGSLTWESVLGAAKIVRLEGYRELVRGTSTGALQKLATADDANAELSDNESSESPRMTSAPTSPLSSRKSLESSGALAKRRSGASRAGSALDHAAPSTSSSSVTASPAISAFHPPYLFDLDHTPGAHPKVSSDVFPCLTSSYDYWNDSPTVQRGLTTKELFGLIGVPMLPQHGSSWTCSWAGLVDHQRPDALTRSACLSLTGNGMHLNAVGSLLMWTLGNLIRKEKFNPWTDAPLLYEEHSFGSFADSAMNVIIDVDDDDELQDEQQLHPM